MALQLLLTVAVLVSGTFAADTTEYCCPHAKKCLTPSSSRCNPSDAKACGDPAFPVCCPVTKLCVKPGADCAAPAACNANEYCCPDAKHCLTASNSTCATDTDCGKGFPTCCPLTKLCVKVGDPCDSPCGEAPPAVSLIPGKLDLNPLCYECPTEAYAEKVMKGDPFIPSHTKVDGTCASQGYEKFVHNDPVFKDAKLFIKSSPNDLASCTGSGDPASAGVCYQGAAGIGPAKETVKVTLEKYASGAGTMKLSGSGIKTFTCGDHTFSKSGQDIKTDLSDCLSDGVTLDSVKYCSDTDEIAIVIKDKTVPIPVHATLSKVPCGSDSALVV